MVEVYDLREFRFEMNRKGTLWDSMKNFFNNRLSQTVTRRELLDYLDSSFSMAVGKARVGSSTIDTYRNYLTQAGYLTKVGRGKYLCSNEIPIDLSLVDVKNEAYGSPPMQRIIMNNIKYRKTPSEFKSIEDLWTTVGMKKKKKKEFIMKDEFSV